MPRPPRINRDQIVVAAMAIADDQGLTAVTMAAVAGRLGVTPMALYRWVPGKAELVDLLVGRLLTEFPPPADHLPWADRLAYTAGEIRKVAHRHPAVFPLVLERPATTPEARRTRDGVVAALVEAGIPTGAAQRLERVVSSAILGFVVSEVAGRFRDHAPAQRDLDFELLLEVLGGSLQAAARG
jgi:AcrR family transcriptional regulator